MKSMEIEEERFVVIRDIAKNIACMGLANVECIALFGQVVQLIHNTLMPSSAFFPLFNYT